MLEQKQCIICLETQTKEHFRVFVNGELSKICKACHGKKISDTRQRNKHERHGKQVPEQPIKYIEHSEQIHARKDFNQAMKKYSDDLNGKIIIMDLRDFYSAIRAVYEDGKNSVMSCENIQEINLSKIVEQALKRDKNEDSKNTI